MNTVLKRKIQVARKNYFCNACEDLCADDFMSNPKDYNVSFSDMRIMVRIKKEGYMVLEGSKYLYQVGIYDDFYAIHCRLDAMELCRKYDLFDN